MFFAQKMTRSSVAGMTVGSLLEEAEEVPLEEGLLCSEEDWLLCSEEDSLEEGSEEGSSLEGSAEDSVLDSDDSVAPLWLSSVAEEVSLWLASLSEEEVSSLLLEEAGSEDWDGKEDVPPCVPQDVRARSAARERTSFFDGIMVNS